MTARRISAKSISLLALAAAVLACSLLPTALPTPVSQPSAVESSTEPAATAPAANWSAGLAVANTGEVAVGSAVYFSSSKLLASWTPTQAVDHYEVAATDGRSTLRYTAEAVSSNITLGGLNSGTEYSITVKVCLDGACSQSLASESISGKTSEEYWQVQGTGNSFATATKLIADGNTKAYPIVYGDWAGEQLAGKAQLYYDPNVRDEKGAKIGELSAAKADSLEAVFLFAPVSGYGLKRVCEPLPGAPGQPPQKADCPGDSLAAQVLTFQALPLSAEMGGAIRLFFEAEGTDHKTRVMYLDSQDGYTGRDFNAGAGTVCGTIADYSVGGGCAPTAQIGVDGDAVGGAKNVTAARQFKIGYPTLDDWRWNGAAGTFMFVTVDLPKTCSDYFFTVGYAVWDGAQWQMQMDDDGCPKHIGATQAIFPIHTGGVRYKLYFSHNRVPNGGGADLFKDPKPIQVIYANGSATGDPAVVDFEDWESVESAREVHYLWPDGTELDEKHESLLDDYAFFAPTGDLNLQVMYANMSDPPGAGGVGRPPFTGVCVLLNP